MPYLELHDDFTRDRAAEVLTNNGFVWSQWHDSYLDERYATYSEADDDWYSDEADGLCRCEHCDRSFHREVNCDFRESEDPYYYFCDDECASEYGLYCHEDGQYYDYPESGLREYHTGERVIHRTTVDRPFLIGFEVEKEDQDCRNELESDSGLPSGWCAEHDSSLDDETGFELVSPAYNLADRERIFGDFDAMSGFLNADSGYSCGGHITVSKQHTSGYELADKNRGLFPLLMCLYPRRLKSTYVRSAKYNKLVDSDDKYRPFRITGSVIELRIISRVTSVDCLKWRYELVRYMLENQPTVRETRQSLESGWLRQHMLKVYEADRLRDKLALFDAFAAYFYDMPIDNLERIDDYLTASID